MAADTIIEFTAHCPLGVTEILATSFDYCIGRIDHETGLKYLHKKQSPDIEAQIYTILGHHHRIISFKGGNALQGLRLEFATNGSLAQYLKLHNPSILQKLSWSQQAAEGTAYIHASSVLHCDLNVNNLLLAGFRKGRTFGRG